MHSVFIDLPAEKMRKFPFGDKLGPSTDKCIEKLGFYTIIKVLVVCTLYKSCGDLCSESCLILLGRGPP